MDKKTFPATANSDYIATLPVMFPRSSAYWDHYDRSKLSDLILRHSQLYLTVLLVSSNLPRSDFRGRIWKTKKKRRNSPAPHSPSSEKIGYTHISLKRCNLRRYAQVMYVLYDGLAEDLRTIPIRLFNIQDRENTLGWTQQNMKNKVAIDRDIDRQCITQQESPKKVLYYITYLMQTEPTEELVLPYGLFYLGTPMIIILRMMDFSEEFVSGGNL